MFFLRRKGAPDLTLPRVMGLRLSLNTPVVDTAELPVGPARAAILVHEEPDGRPNVTIGVRSLKNGEVAFYSYPGDLREETSTAAGASAAISFGEGMGFLFDDDEIQEGLDDERSLALGLWGELMAAGAPTGPGADVATVGESDLLGTGVPLGEDALLEVGEDVLESGEDPELPVLELLPDDEVVSVDELDTTDAGIVEAEPTLPPLGEVSPAAAATPGEAVSDQRFLPEPTLPPIDEALAEPTLPPLDETLAEANEPALEPAPPAAPAQRELEIDFAAAAADGEADLPADPAPPLPKPDAEIAAAARDCVVEPEAEQTPEPALSKFRQRLPQGAAEGSGTSEGKGGRQALGRLKLVKRRTPASEEERRKWLVRLLSAF